ncbi:sialidase family protein [Paenibacillus filicis]|uniref:Sialidase family protein n=1 Tax=Paenibacillus gyeongsangnamensis TaxID=3388067 RepID=A0ABT4Q9M4_9BACL|nr:sialidase family protein [Paenibacillus filicis]MCZ8513589.1 sialidase family protein [Paenibacillus filicis]
MANFQVTPGGNPKNEPSVAANLLDANIVVAVSTDNTTGSPRTGLYRSLNAGSIWSNTLLPLPAQFTGAEAATVAYGFPSTFLVAAHLFPGNFGGTTGVYRSTDNGATFTGPVLVAQGQGTFINNDETNISIDNSQASPFLGNAYLTYNHQFNVNIAGGSVSFFQRSVDNGISFQTPIRLSNEAELVERTDVAVGFTGIVYAGWITLDPAPAFKMRRSLDGGATFQPEVVISAVTLVPSPLPVPNYAFRCLTFPNMATDNSATATNGTVYAVWQDNRLGFADIFISKSFDEGVTWTAPMKVTDSPAGSQNFFPAIAVSPITGRVNIIYYTNRLNGFNLDVFVAQSMNGGNTFTNTRVTTVSFDPNAGGSTPTTLIGDFIDVDIIVPNDFIAVWMDTRPGTQTIFAGNNL